MDPGADPLAVVVRIRDPDAHRVDARLVGDALGLTPAESCAAALLPMGRASVGIGRIESTLRWALKNAPPKPTRRVRRTLVRLV